MEDYRCYLGYFTTLLLDVPKLGGVEGYLMVLNEEPDQFFMICTTHLKTFSFSMEKTKWQLTQFMLSEKDVDKLNEFYSVIPRFRQRNTGQVSWSSNNSSKVISHGKNSLAEEIFHDIKVKNSFNNGTPQPCYLFSDETSEQLASNDQNKLSKQILTEITENNEKSSYASPKKRMKLNKDRKINCSVYKDKIHKNADKILDSIFTHDSSFLSRTTSEDLEPPKGDKTSCKDNRLQRQTVKKHKHPIPHTRHVEHLNNSQAFNKSPHPVNHFQVQKNTSTIHQPSTCTSVTTTTALVSKIATQVVKTITNSKNSKIKHCVKEAEDVKPVICFPSHPRYKLLRNPTSATLVKPCKDFVFLETKQKKQNLFTSNETISKPNNENNCSSTKQDLENQNVSKDISKVTTSHKNDDSSSSEDETDNLCNSFNKTFNPQVMLDDCRSPDKDKIRYNGDDCGDTVEHDVAMTEDMSIEQHEKNMMEILDMVKSLHHFTKHREKARRRSLKKLLKLRDTLQQEYDESSSSVADHLKKLQLNATKNLDVLPTRIQAEINGDNSEDPVIAVYDQVNRQLVQRLADLEQSVTKASKERLDFEKQRFLQEYWKRIQRCDNCQRCGMLATCEECRSVFYCCKKCQIEDWNRRHSRECEIKGKKNEHEEIKNLKGQQTQEEEEFEF